MLHALGINSCYVVRNSKRAQKCHNDFMSLFGGGRNPAPFVGEENRPIWLAGYDSIPLQAGDGAVHGDMGDAQSLGQIHHARLSHGICQVSNGFRIILSGL